MTTLSVGPGQEEAVSIFKMVIASGWRPWRARLNAMAADRGRGAEAGAGRAVALTGRYSFDSGNGNPIGRTEKEVEQTAENAKGFKREIAKDHFPLKIC